MARARRPVRRRVVVGFIFGWGINREEVGLKGGSCVILWRTVWLGCVVRTTSGLGGRSLVM